MAVRPIQVSELSEISVLIVKQCNFITSQLVGGYYPDLDGMNNAIKRLGELQVAFKEAMAALPQPVNETVMDRKRA